MSNARRFEERIAAVLERAARATRTRDEGGVDRRKFLVAGGGLVSAAVLTACNSYGPRSAQPLLQLMERTNADVESALFHASSRDRPSKSAREAGNAFPVYYVSDSVPMWDEQANGPWTLEIGGAVSHPVRLSLTDLMQMTRTDQRVDHFCVEGWNAVATWNGVRFRELAALVKPLPTAQFVDFQSFDDDYHESWDLASAMHPQTLIAYGMDGHMLGAPHGGPARVHSPVKLGYKNTKYLTKIVFIDHANGGYWTDRGYEWYGGT